MKYQTPKYEMNAIETNDIMSVSSEATDVDVSVEQQNNASNIGVAFDQLMNKYFK